MKSLFAVLGLVAVAAIPLLGQGPIVRVNQVSEAANAPTVLTVSNTVVGVFTLNTSRSDGRVLMRSIQNTGTNAVLYSINNTNVSATSYHGVIAGGVSVRDGLGSVLDCSRIPFPIYVRTESGTATLAIVDLTQ